jgi:proteasome inhibitor subunit 1 (PI31)
MADPLDTSTLLSLLLLLLPTSSSSPLIKPTDAVAALIHTIHTVLDFRLIPQPASAAPPPPTSEESSAPESGNQAQGEQDFDDTVSETTTAVDQDQDQDGDGPTGSGPGGNTRTVTEGRLPTGWNARGEESYTFEYRHAQSAMVFRIRVGRMGGRIQIDGMAEVSTARSVYAFASQSMQMQIAIPRSRSFIRS